MKKIIAIIGLASLGFSSAQAGVSFGISLGIPAPVVVARPVVVAPAPVVVAPAPVVVAPAPVVVQPPMPAPVVEVAPVCPVAGYVWVGGNWGWCGNRWVWTRGHWGPPVYRGGYPHYGYRGGYYYHGGHR